MIKYNIHNYTYKCIIQYKYNYTIYNVQIRVSAMYIRHQAEHRTVKGRTIIQ